MCLHSTEKVAQIVLTIIFPRDPFPPKLIYFSFWGGRLKYSPFDVLMWPQVQGRTWKVRLFGTPSPSFLHYLDPGDQKLLTQWRESKAEKQGKADHTASPTTHFQDWSFTVRGPGVWPLPLDWTHPLLRWESWGHKVSWVFCIIIICKWLKRLAGPSELPPWARESLSHDMGWLGRGEKEI